MQNKDPSPKRSCPNHPHRGSWDEKLKNRNVVVMMMMITSWTRSFQASWKWVPKRIPGPPWSVGSAEVLPKQTRNMDPHLFISFDLAPRNAAKSVWNCFLYAFAVCSFAPCMYTLPLLYAIDLLSRALSGTCFMQSYSLVCSTTSNWFCHGKRHFPRNASKHRTMMWCAGYYTWRVTCHLIINRAIKYQLIIKWYVICHVHYRHNGVYLIKYL